MEAGRLDVDEATRVVTVHPPREVDIATAPLLDLLLSQAVALGPSQVVVDLDGLTFIDHHGVVMLTAAQATLTARGASLVVVNPSRAFRRVAWSMGGDAARLSGAGEQE